MKNKHLFTYTTDIAKYETARTKVSLSGKSINFVADPKEPFIAVNPLDDVDLVKFKTLPENTVSKNQENAILVSTGNFTQWELLKNVIVQPQSVLPSVLPAIWEYVVHTHTVPLTEEVLEGIPTATIIVSTQNPENKGGLYYFTEDAKLKKIAFTDDITSGSGVTEQYLKDHGVLPELSADNNTTKTASTLCFYNSNEYFDSGSKLDSIINPCIVNHLQESLDSYSKVSLCCGPSFGLISLATINYVDSKVSTINASINSLKDTVTATSTNVTTASSNANTALSAAKKALSTANSNKNDITNIKKESSDLGDALKLSYIRGNEDLTFLSSVGFGRRVFSSDLVKISDVLSYKDIIGILKGFYRKPSASTAIPKGKLLCNRNEVVDGQHPVYLVTSDILWTEISNISNKEDEKTFYKNFTNKLALVEVY